VASSSDSWGNNRLTNTVEAIREAVIELLDEIERNNLDPAEIIGATYRHRDLDTIFQLQSHATSLLNVPMLDVQQMHVKEVWSVASGC